MLNHISNSNLFDMGLEQDDYQNLTMVKSYIDKMDSLYREYRYIEDSYASLSAIPPSDGHRSYASVSAHPPPVPISPGLTPGN